MAPSKKRSDASAVECGSIDSRQKVQVATTVGQAPANGQKVMKFGSQMDEDVLAESRGGGSFHASWGGSKSEKVTEIPFTISEGRAIVDTGVLMGGPIDRTSQYGVVCAHVADAGHGQSVRKSWNDLRAARSECMNVRHSIWEQTLELSDPVLADALPTLSNSTSFVSCLSTNEDGQLARSTKLQPEVGCDQAGKKGAAWDVVAYAVASENPSAYVLDVGPSAEGPMPLLTWGLEGNTEHSGPPTFGGGEQKLPDSNGSADELYCASLDVRPQREVESHVNRIAF